MEYSLLISREFWRTYLTSMQRFTRDSRARKKFLALTIALLGLLFPVVYIITVARLPQDRDLTITLCVVVSIELAIILGVQWRWHREEQRQLAEDIASADPVHVQRLQKLAYGLAALNERASSELFTHFKSLPEGFTVNTRRIHIDLLKANGVWDDLPGRVRLWLMRPDGGWPAEVALQVRQTEEKLHTLLWALALTAELRPLERMEKPLDFAALEKLLARQAIGIRPTWDLRAARNAAQPYFIRLYAESIHRGQQEARSEGQAEGVETWISAIAQGDEPDRLSGARTIAELDDSALTRVGQSGACRYQVLSMLLESLDTNQHWRAFVARLLGSLPGARFTEPNAL